MEPVVQKRPALHKTSLNTELLIFISISAVALFVHCYKLGTLPYGVHVDEMGMGYDAWCIANFGVDRYLKSFPVYMTNFGGGQSSLYCYCAAIFVKLFGLSAVTLRIPVLISSVVVYVFGALIIKENYGGNKRIILTFAALYTIMPYFIMASRFGLDCNLMLSTSTVFIYLFSRAINLQTDRSFIYAGVAGGVVLYSYVLSYIVLPLFLVISLLMLCKMKKINPRQLLYLGIPMGIVALPLILVQIVNMKDLEELKIGFLTITKLKRYRVADIAFSKIGDHLYEAVKSILMYDALPYNTDKGFGTLYWISIPLVVIGCYHSVREAISNFKISKYTVSMLVTAWAAAELILGCLLEGGGGPNANKMNGIFFCLLFFAVDGIVLIYNNVTAKKLIMGFVAACYAFSFVSFANYYFNDYTEKTYPLPYFAGYPAEAVDFLKTLDGHDTKTVYFGGMSRPYVYYLAATKTSPYDFNISENGTERYKNIVFDDPATVDRNAIYVYRNSSKDKIKMLINNGFEKKICDDYCVMWHES